MKRFDRFEHRTEVMKEIKRRYNIPAGKQPNIHFYEFQYGKEKYGRWHIQVKEGQPDVLGMGTKYDPGRGEWWPFEMWLKNPVEPVWK